MTMELKLTINELKQCEKTKTMDILLSIVEECFDESGLIPDKNQEIYEKICYRIAACNNRLKQLDNM